MLQNPADSVHCPLLYIYNGKTSISKEQNDSILLLDGQTLPISRFDFENLTQSEAREPPTSGHQETIIIRNGCIIETTLYYIHLTIYHSTGGIPDIDNAEAFFR